MISGVCLAQFSLNNVHKRGQKHHHFISQLSGRVASVQVSLSILSYSSHVISPMRDCKFANGMSSSGHSATSGTVNPHFAKHFTMQDSVTLAQARLNQPIASFTATRFYSSVAALASSMLKRSSHPLSN